MYHCTLPLIYAGSIYQVRIAEAGGVELLVDLLVHGSDDVKESAVGALGNLAGHQLCKVLRMKF